MFCHCPTKFTTHQLYFGQQCPKLYWRHTVNSSAIQFEDTPFSLGEKRILHCQYGVQYYKSKPHSSDKVFMQGTGCTAQIEINEFVIYPKYSIKSTLSPVLSKSTLSPVLSQKRIRKLREDSLKSLRKALTSAEPPLVVHKYFVQLPTEEAHHECHPTKRVMGLSQRIHPDLISKIHELVSIGTVEPIEVERLLKHHVKHYMTLNNGVMPDPNDRAYFPTLYDIKNHISRAKKALQLSVVDQENAELFIWKQREQTPESNSHFRPYKLKHSSPKSKLSALENTDFESTLLWVHQEAWQQQLMVKYGNTMSLMDATYKTTRYDLPLFFISVRTNSGYCVVAEFIVQSESATCIEEALSILMSWNPGWKPQFFMTDYSEAEIAALETCFPGVSVYLCDFHREQAW